MGTPCSKADNNQVHGKLEQPKAKQTKRKSN